MACLLLSLHVLAPARPETTEISIDRPDPSFIAIELHVYISKAANHDPNRHIRRHVDLLGSSRDRDQMTDHQSSGPARRMIGQPAQRPERLLACFHYLGRNRLTPHDNSAFTVEGSRILCHDKPCRL